jgi:hypothetical protein
LERILSDFDSVSGEDATDITEQNTGTTATEDDNNSEAQSERLERLYQEGELTNEEFELLRTELVESNESESSAASDNQDRDPVDWLPEDTLNRAVDMYREGIEDSDPYSDTISGIDFQIAALPSDASVSVILPSSGGSPPTVLLILTEQDDEERLQEHIEQHAPCELDSIASGMAFIELNVIQSGYDGQVSDEDLIIEINHLLQTITHTYGMSMSELSEGSITVEPDE